MLQIQFSPPRRNSYLTNVSLVLGSSLPKQAVSFVQFNRFLSSQNNFFLFLHPPNQQQWRTTTGGRTYLWKATMVNPKLKSTRRYWRQSWARVRTDSSLFLLNQHCHGPHVFCGDCCAGGVGKSTLTRVFCGDTFIQEYTPTIGLCLLPTYSWPQLWVSYTFPTKQRTATRTAYWSTAMMSPWCASQFFLVLHPKFFASPTVCRTFWMSTARKSMLA